MDIEGQIFSFLKFNFNELLGESEVVGEDLLEYCNSQKILLSPKISFDAPEICDVTGRKIHGTKLKMLIFTLYLHHNLQSWVLVFQKFM